ncbi:hypothetical protein OROMI_034979 [Orobanche minor]
MVKIMDRGYSPLTKLSNNVNIEQIRQVTEKLWSKDSKQWTGLFEKDFQRYKDRVNQTSTGEVMVKTMDSCSPLKKISNGVKIEQIGQVIEKLWSKQWTCCRPFKKLSNGVKIEQIGQVTEKLWSKQWTGCNPLKKLSNDVKIKQIGQITEKLWSEQWTTLLYPFEKSFQRCKDRANRIINGEVMVKTMDRLLYPFEKSFHRCKDRANRIINGEVMVKTMDRGCSSLKKISNGIKIEQITQVPEKLWSKQ